MLIRHRLATALALLCTGTSVQADPELHITTNLIWDYDRSWFGGLSGVEISNQGNEITVLSDSNFILVAKMIRDADRLVGLEFVSSQLIRSATGGRARKTNTDSEGLAIDDVGNVFASFEDNHRVAAVEREGRLLCELPRHPDFADFSKNGGLEALAIHPDGTLWAIPETTARSFADFPIYSYDGDKWSKDRTLPRRGPFLPVGADFDADGRLFVLERAVTLLGFRSRIRLLVAQGPDVLTERTLWITGPGQFDNLEGLSVWSDPQGRLRLTLVSDDNYLRIQRTQIVEFIVKE